MARASNKVLDSLHAKLAQVMLDALDGETIVDEDGKEIHFKANNPALFTAVTNFLKLNNIVAVPDSESALDDLKKKLASQGKTILPAAEPGDVKWQNENHLN